MYAVEEPTGLFSVAVWRKPCGIKSVCDSCWAGYQQRVLRQFAEKCATFASYSSLIRKSRTSANAFRMRCKRAGQGYISVPQMDNSDIFITTGIVPGLATTSEPLEVLRRALRNHDRSKRVNSSYGVKAAARPQSQSGHYFMLVADVESVVENAEKLGLQASWSGIDQADLGTVDKTELESVIGRAL